MHNLFSRPLLGRRGLLFGSASLVAAPAIVRAQGRNGVALVVGNSKYLWEAPLPNVRRDAPDVARRFEGLGLKTETLLDADRASMLAALGRLKAAAAGARLAVIYFAGHGVATDNGEMLVPVDADLSNPASISALVPVAAFHESVAGAANKLLVFDNCRNNPADGWRQLEAQRKASVRKRAGGEGSNLGPAGPNTLVLHSTAPGSVAIDGAAGQNSPFALAFLRGLDQPSQNIQALVPQMRRELLLATGGRQVLFSSSNLGAGLALAPGATPTSTPSMAMPDATRLIELPRAYAFVRENQLILPPGLVAIRSDVPTLQSLPGSYQFSTSNKFGTLPTLAIVLAASAQMANVVVALVGRNGNVNWQLYQVPVTGKSVKLYGGSAEASEWLFDWSQENKPTATQLGLQQGGIGIQGMRVVPLSRLDG